MAESSNFFQFKVTPSLPDWKLRLCWSIARATCLRDCKALAPNTTLPHSVGQVTPSSPILQAHPMWHKHLEKRIQDFSKPPQISFFMGVSCVSDSEREGEVYDCHPSWAGDASPECLSHPESLLSCDIPHPDGVRCSEVVSATAVTHGCSPWLVTHSTRFYSDAGLLWGRPPPMTGWGTLLLWAHTLEYVKF